MVPKRQRLSRADFSRRRVKTVPFSFGSITVLDSTRAAVVVSKKIAPSAVSRNRLRRRVYEIIRPALSAGAKKGYIVFANKNAARAPFSELKSELEKALKRC